MILIPEGLPASHKVATEGTAIVEYKNSSTIEYSNATYVESERDFVLIRYGNNESILINRDVINNIYVQETKFEKM